MYMYKQHVQECIVNFKFFFWRGGWMWGFFICKTAILVIEPH